MKVLIFEATPATPHPETALEIAVKEKYSGSEVVYCPIFHLMPILIWKSNINGRQGLATPDSLVDWLNYLIKEVSPFASVDLPLIPEMPNYVTDEIRADLFGFSYAGESFGSLVKSNAVQIFNSIEFSDILRDHFDVCVGLAQTAIIAYNVALSHITKHKPDVVYIFNGRTASTWPIYLVCQALGVRCLVHERGSNKNRYSIWNRPPQYQDVVKAAISKFASGRDADAARLSAASFYYRQKTGRTATFAFNNLTQDHSAPIDIPGLRNKFVVYFTTSNYEVLLMPNQDVTNALGEQDSAVETLCQVCREEGLQLVIKMHPGTPKAELNAFDRFADGTECIVIPPGSSVSSYVLGEAAFRILTYGSTLTWEFMYSGRGCAVLSNTIGRGEAGVVELDSKESIRTYLVEELAAVDRTYAIMYADFMANYGEEYEFYRPVSLFSGTFDATLTAAT